MPGSDWLGYRLDNQVPMNALQMKNFIDNYSNNLTKSLEVDMTDGVPGVIQGGKTKKTPMLPNHAYCLKCKKASKIQNQEHKELVKKNGTKIPSLKGKCLYCGSNVFRILSKQS